MFNKRVKEKKDSETCDVKQGRQAIRGGVAIVLCLITTVIQMLYDPNTLIFQGGEDWAVFCSFYLLPSLLLAGICGIVPSMLSFLMVFTYKWIFQSNIAYAETIILLSDIVLYHFVRSGSMRHRKKAVLFTIWLILFTGPVWQLFMILLDGRLLSEYTPLKLLAAHVGVIPECILAIVIIYLYLNKAPDKYKHYAFMGLLKRLCDTKQLQDQQTHQYDHYHRGRGAWYRSSHICKLADTGYLRQYHE